jgi:aldehyde dehydrogenase (NAD+)
VTTAALPAPTANPAIAEWRMFVDGKLVASSSGALFADIDPATEEVVGVTADGSGADMDAAIAAARRAFDRTGWSRDPAFRRHCLEQLHAALERHKEEIRPLLVTEVGTPAWLTRDTLLDVPIDRLADYARMATEYPYETDLPELDFRGVVSRRRQHREAVGVVAAITPWNGPWGVNLIKIGPALAAGNTVVLKPSPDAPWSATIIGRLAAEETDLPPGVLNVVPGSDHALGAQLTTDPRVDLVTFTGSAANGRRIAAAAAGTLKRLVLELGGKSAHVVLPGAPLEAEAAAAGRTICVNSGQGCVARSRLLLPREEYEAGVEAAATAMAAVVVGPPADPGTFMGPLISSQHRTRVLDHIATGTAQGARLVRGGGVPPWSSRGYYVEPTLFADVDPASVIAQEEIFGPVLAVIPYDDEDQAVRIANDSIYGLSASVVGPDEESALHVAKRLRVGTCSVNGGQWMHMDVPFGGYKQSGVGREFGVRGFEEYLETKVLGLSTPRRPASSSW